jgi:hypothetical protein
MEKFNLPASNSGIQVPVLSALCKMNNNVKEQIIFIYAKGRSNDMEMMKLFGKSPGCPYNSVKGGGTRCNITDSTKKYCKLSWHSTGSEKPVFDFLECPKDIKMKPDAQASAIENQKFYIIIGACCGLFILLIVIIIFCIISVKKLKKAEKKRGKDEDEINTISKNPYYESGQIEGGSMLPYNDPYYEVNNTDIVEMSRNPYYGTDQPDGTPVGSDVYMRHNPYYDGK